jgi:deoxycytidylate deaminase
MWDICEPVAPREVWLQAIGQAQRSTIHTFKTGAVIIDQDDNFISRGCSHHGIDPTRSIHAEEHAIRNAQMNGVRDFVGFRVVVVTLGKSGNFAYSSRPCFRCTQLLRKHVISSVHYAERMNDGNWIVNNDSPDELWQRGLRANCRTSNFAKDMRII